MKLNKKNFIALSYRDFRLLWIGLFISFTGTKMQFVAVSWQLYELTHSPIALGMLGLARFIPVAIFLLIGGSFADTYNRKRIMLFGQVALAMSALLLAVTGFTNTITPAIIYTATVIAAIADSFEKPARQAMVPNLVKPEHLINAISLNSIMFQSSRLIGPSIGGIVIAGFGTSVIYAFNTLSFLAVIVSLLMMHASGAVEKKNAGVSFAAIKEGFLFLKSRTILWSVTLLDFLATFFSSATALLPIFARDILHVGALGFGFLYAAEAAGAIIAGIIMTNQHSMKRQGKVILISVALYGIATIIFGLSRVFWLSLLALMAVGAADTVSAILRHTIRQATTPDHLRGRIVAVTMIFFMGGPELGEFEAGVLAAWMGASMAVVTGGVGTVLVVLLMAYKLPLLRNFDTHHNSP